MYEGLVNLEKPYDRVNREGIKSVYVNSLDCVRTKGVRARVLKLTMM